MTCVNFFDIVPKVGEWSDEQFGTGQPSIERLSGMSEEIGELQEAMWANNEPEIRDAIGDITIFLADYCHRDNTFVNAPVNKVRPREEKIPPSTAQIIKYAGRLHHAHLKGLQDIRQDRDTTGEKAKQEAVKDVLGSLNLLCTYLDYNYGDVVNETLEEVLNREW